ncbi:AraC family transcriptional regulator [Dyella amyloliquefaciens]|uniref:AraC family transcriptional regulator n=1 Tax=Dyella amyloliquefaciens TaxID=1770545 RepID=UPI00102E2456|nr:AraC family transcriptional regulator [Dyella amyloliquefaciens]
MIRLGSGEFELFASHLEPLIGNFTLTKRFTHDWCLARLALDSLGILKGQAGGGVLFSGECAAPCYTMLIPLSMPEFVAINGCELDALTVAFLAPRLEFHLPTSGMIQWFGVILDEAIVKQWMAQELIEGRPDQRSHRIGRADASVVRRLSSIVVRALQNHAEQPALFEDLRAREALTQQLLDASLECVQSMDEERRHQVGRPRLGREQIVRSALDVVQGAGSDIPDIDELCRVAGTSRKTLHTVFVEQFGVSPHRYLLLRRLSQIHGALQQADRSETIASICGRFGVWDFGRFSGFYRSIFGVPPSMVLKAAQLS